MSFRIASGRRPITTAPGAEPPRAPLAARAAPPSDSPAPCRRSARRRARRARRRGTRLRDAPCDRRGSRSGTARACARGRRWSGPGRRGIAGRLNHRAGTSSRRSGARGSRWTSTGVPRTPTETRGREPVPWSRARRYRPRRRDVAERDRRQSLPEPECPRCSPSPRHDPVGQRLAEGAAITWAGSGRRCAGGDGKPGAATFRMDPAGA